MDTAAGNDGGDGDRHRELRGPQMPYLNIETVGRSVERWASLAPWILLGYVAAQCVVRLLLSSNLEWDESYFIGQSDFRLGYGNSQGPLYNWVIGIAHALSGSWPVALVVPKHLFLAATYLLQYDLVRRLTGSAVAAAAGAFALLLIPQIVVLSEVTLTQTVLVQACVVAMLHGLLLVLERATFARCLWLGIAISGGILTKYNFLIVVLAIFAAVLIVPQVRGRLVTPMLFTSLVVVFLAISPHAIWAMVHPANVIEHLSKLSDRSRYFDWLDVPSLGFDGLLSFAWGVAVAILPLYLVWRLSVGRSVTVPAELAVGVSVEAMRRFFFLVWILCIAVFSIVVLALDAHQVHLRYVTPLIMAFPIWIGLAWPVARNPIAAGRIVFCASVFAVIVAIGWPFQAMVTRGPLNYPYAEMAEAIARSVEPPFAIMTRAPVDQNVTARIEGATVWDERNPAESVLVVVREDDDIGHAAEKLGADYAPIGDEGKASFPNYYFIDRTRTLRWQMFERQSIPVVPD